MQLIRQRLGRLRRVGHDDGFTLIEMVVTVAILGVVSAALFGVVLQYLKTTTDSRTRLSESTDQQFISTYWQTDVSSLGRQSFNAGSVTGAQGVFVGPAGPPGGCGTAAGTVVVAFAWHEFEVSASSPTDAWNASPQEVAYVAVANGSRLALRRVRCRDGVADAPQTVAHNLVAAPTIACDTSCVAATPPNRVSMTFAVRDADNPSSPGYTTTVSADRRQG